MITLDGLVISERIAGESDKHLTVFTESLGAITVCVRGASKITGKNHATTQLFCYSKFCISPYKDRYYLNSSELIHDFYDLRLDIKKLALACYFAEISKFTSIISDSSREKNIMRLFLNTLYMLSKSKRTCEFLKSVFELRFMSEIGFMPNVVGCHHCYNYSLEKYYFLIDRGYFVCFKDFYEIENDRDHTKVVIHQGEFKTFQHICLASMEQLYNFKLSPEVQSNISYLTEKYLRYHLDSDFKSLRYYKGLDL